MSLTVQAIRARAKVAEESVNGKIVAVVSTLASLVVSLGFIDSAEESAIVVGSTALLNVVGSVTHALHSGKINPSGLSTYIGTVVAQACVLGVSFGIWGASASTEIVAVSSAVVLAGLQIAHALFSRSVE